MYRKTFACFCRTVSLINAIFNMVHATSDINNIHKFQDISKILCTERESAQTDKQTECINTFQLC